MPNKQQPESVDLASLRDAFDTHPIDDVALKKAVCEFVDEMRRVGLSVEQTIIQVKRAAATRSDPVFRALRARANDPDDEQAIVNRAVTWCIERYFEDAPRA